MRLIVVVAAIMVALARVPASAEPPQEPQPSAIADVMEARERATLPFTCTFQAELQRGAEKDLSGSYEGSLTWCPDGRLLRKKRSVLRPEAKSRDRASDVLELEEVVLLREGRFTHIRRRVDPPGADWRGEVSAKAPDDWQPTPVTFGLYLHETEAFSQLLRRKRVKVLGYELLDDERCLKVVVDVFAGTADRWTSPLVLWLSESKGYFPLRFTLFITEATERYRPGADIELDGRRFKPKTLYEVEQIVSFGSAWLPTRCTMKTPFALESETLLTLRVDPASARKVDCTEALALPGDVRRALVRDETTGRTEVVGAQGGSVSEEELRNLEDQTRQVGLAEGHRTPVDSVPPYKFLLVGLAGIGVGAAWIAIRRRRRKGNAHDAAT